MGYGTAYVGTLEHWHYDTFQARWNAAWRGTSLVNFVEQMAHVSGGVAAYCNANDLGNMVIESFVGGRKRKRAV